MPIGRPSNVIEHSKAELDHDVDGLIATLVPDCCYEFLPTGERWTGLDEARRFYLEFFDAFPDAEMLATDLVIGPQGVFLAADLTANAPRPLDRCRSDLPADLHPDGDPVPLGRSRRKVTGERVWFADNRGLLGALGNSG